MIQANISWHHTYNRYRWHCGADPDILYIYILYCGTAWHIVTYYTYNHIQRQSLECHYILYMQLYILYNGTAWHNLAYHTYSCTILWSIHGAVNGLNDKRLPHFCQCHIHSLPPLCRRLLPPCHTCTVCRAHPAGSGLSGSLDSWMASPRYRENTQKDPTSLAIAASSPIYAVMRHPKRNEK